MSGEKVMDWRLWGSLALVGALIAAEVLHLRAGRDTTVREITCPDPRQGCMLQPAGLEGGNLRFVGGLSPLRPFDLVVTAPHAKTVHASFSMVGMDMGLNRYQLVAEEGAWRAKVVLPACVTGRRDWLLDLYVDGVVVRLAFQAGK